MDHPLVSIIINNFNYGRFLRQAVESALAQTDAAVEVVVVDDGSTDDSRQIIAGFGDLVRPVLKRNGGQGSTLNAGFAASRGDLVCFLDADDRFLPQKAARLVEAAERYPEAGWFFHAMRLFAPGSDETISVVRPDRAGLIDTRPMLRRGKMPPFAPATSAICFRRQLLARLLPMPEMEGTSADRYVKAVAQGLSCGCWIDEVLAEQRIHGENAYTLRPEKQRVAAKSYVLCASWIRERFPALSHCADKMLATGLGIYRRTGGIDAAYAPVIERYLRAVSFLDRCGIEARAAYHAQPWLQRLRAIAGGGAGAALPSRHAAADSQRGIVAPS